MDERLVKEMGYSRLGLDKDGRVAFCLFEYPFAEIEGKFWHFFFFFFCVCVCLSFLGFCEVLCFNIANKCFELDFLNVIVFLCVWWWRLELLESKKKKLFESLYICFGIIISIENEINFLFLYTFFFKILFLLFFWNIFL